MLFDIDTCSKDGKHNIDARRNVYDSEMVLTDISFGREKHEMDLPITKSQFNEMKKYANILSSPFPFCRVDFYVIKNEIIFGEMTFYPMGGVNITKPIGSDIMLGNWIDLSKIDKKYLI